MSDTYLSLFSGIGGLDLAVEAHGFRCVGQVEWDAFCTRILERWWPTVRRWGDITGFGVDELDERPDLVCGGFPCQPHSIAGRRRGTADDRWLWPEFARVVRELGPRLVLVENVPGLLVVNGGRALSEILGTLADMGYDTTWGSVRASDVGAPHRRERVFLLAHADGAALREQPIADAGIVGASVARGVVAHADDGGHVSDLRPPSVPGVRESEAGSEPRGADRGRVVADAGDEPADPDESRSQGTGSERSSRGRPDLDAGDVPTPDGDRGFPWGPYRRAVERWERILNRPAPHPVDEKGRLAPPFVEWMMGLPSGWTEGLTRPQALKALGNAVVPQQGAAAFSVLRELSFFSHAEGMDEGSPRGRGDL